MQPDREFRNGTGTPTLTCRACREWNRRYFKKQKAARAKRLEARPECPQPRNGAGRPVAYLDDQKAAAVCIRCPLDECVYVDFEIPRQWCPLTYWTSAYTWILRYHANGAR
jgi:hypothetical protein